MKKKIILSLALTALLIAIFAISVSAATPVNAWNISDTSSDIVYAYLYNDENNAGYYTLTISGTGDMEDFSYPDYAPWYSANYEYNITSVTIEDGVTSIGEYAFYWCTALTSIVIPEGVSSIGNCAFYYCDFLTSIVIPEGVTYIGNSAFYECSSLTSIVIPESVTSIGNSAFYSCDSLTSVELPEGVTYIGNQAFENCHKLVEVYNKSSLNITKGSSSYGYVGCYALNIYTPNNGESKMFTTPDGFVFYDDGAKRYLVGYTGTETDITLPSTCNGYGYEIYVYAFYYCKSLTSIVIPEVVTFIGNSAFRECISLTSIVIPKGVTYIGDQAFFGCTRLTSIVIPQGVTSIGFQAFSFCSSLTSIVIPEGATYIGDYAFGWCSSLTIYCEAENQPSGWSSSWNSSNCPVVWGYFDEIACLEDIFTFKGYSFSANGGFAVGFAIDYDALAKYEAKTGKTLEIGVVFAGYEHLGGKQPLDQNGEAITLEIGKVVKADITEYGYKYYDFMLTGFVDSIKDIKLVIAGYIFDGEAVKYVQANGMSDTVNGITYNEALKG